jgi:hypothetical protein
MPKEDAIFCHINDGVVFVVMHASFMNISARELLDDNLIMMCQL